MPRPCAACTHPRQAELDRRLRSGSTIVDVVLWLATTERPIARNALGRHANKHLGVLRTPGPRPVAGSFLERIVEAVDEDIHEGRQRPTVSHGIAAQAEINRQQQREADRDLVLRITAALTGVAGAPIQLPDPTDPLEQERLIHEGTFRELLEAGA